MCPLCLATTGLYLAGGLSAGAVATFLAVKLLPPKQKEITNAAADDRIQK
jgi:hypothetical protein